MRAIARKYGGLGVSALLVIWAIAIGGGLPPPPGELLSAARSAASNVAVAADNLERAERDTRALVKIARNVRSQLDSSERLLETQLEIEEMSRSSLRRSRAMSQRILGIDRAIEELGERLRQMTSLATQTGGQAEDAADAAGVLQRTLDELRKRFERLIEESRELNRKARGYEEFRDGPG